MEELRAAETRGLGSGTNLECLVIVVGDFIFVNVRLYPLFWVFDIHAEFHPRDMKTVRGVTCVGRHVEARTAVGEKNWSNPTAPPRKMASKSRETIQCRRSSTGPHRDVHASP